MTQVDSKFRLRRYFLIFGTQYNVNLLICWCRTQYKWRILITFDQESCDESAINALRGIKPLRA